MLETKVVLTFKYRGWPGLLDDVNQTVLYQTTLKQYYHILPDLSDSAVT